jgi:hypothetical protein
VVGSLAYADAPVGRFTVNAGGTVTDNMTHLTWQQAASASTYTWAEASTYCTDGWRLPDIRELQSLVDERRYTPAIDSTAFPNTPYLSFWSASRYPASDTDAAWIVNFDLGYTLSNDVRNMNRVRCVR